MSRGRQLTKPELERIKILVSQGLSILQIAKKLKRSRTLVRNAIENHDEEIKAHNEAVAEEGVDIYTDIIMRGLGKLTDEIESDHLKPFDRAKIVGIMFDKRQLLRGKPTNIEDNNVTTNTGDEAKRIIEAFTEFAIGSSTTGEEGNRIEESIIIRTPLPTTSVEVQDSRVS